MSRRTPKSDKLVGEVLDMSYHRNGVSGRGFWTVLFVGHPEADSLVAGNTFVATFFPADESEDEDWDVEACISVLRLSDLNDGNAEHVERGQLPA